MLFAASRLKQLLTMNATRLISPADAAQFNQLLYHIFPQAVATRNQAVVSALTVLISRFLLVFWLESPEIRDFVKPAVSIYELSPLHACAALELCSSVVQDLQPPYGNFDRFWRKKCLSLRDSGLQSVMQLALHALAGSVQPEHLPFPGNYSLFKISQCMSLFSIWDHRKLPFHQMLIRRCARVFARRPSIFWCTC